MADDFALKFRIRESPDYIGKPIKPVVHSRENIYCFATDLSPDISTFIRRTRVD